MAIFFYVKLLGFSDSLSIAPARITAYSSTGNHVSATVCPRWLETSQAYQSVQHWGGGGVLLDERYTRNAHDYWLFYLFTLSWSVTKIKCSNCGWQVQLFAEIWAGRVYFLHDLSGFPCPFLGHYVGLVGVLWGRGGGRCYSLSSLSWGKTEHSVMPGCCALPCLHPVLSDTLLLSCAHGLIRSSLLCWAGCGLQILGAMGIGNWLLCFQLNLISF